MARRSPIRFSEELFQTILDRLAAGESLRSICQRDGMPCRVTVHGWLEEDEDRYRRYARARDLGVDMLAEEILEIADDARNDWMETHDPNNPGWQANGEHMLRARLRVDTRKWYVSKLAPRKYGERLEHVGAGGEPLLPAQVDLFEFARRMIFLIEEATRNQGRLIEPEPEPK